MQWVARRVTPLLGGCRRQLRVGVAFSSSITSAAPSTSLSAPSRAVTPELCGRGDKKTKRGKRFKGSYGNARPKLKKKVQRIKDKVEVPRSTPWPLPFKLI